MNEEIKNNELKDEELEQVNGGGAPRKDGKIWFSAKVQDAAGIKGNVLDMAVGVIVGGTFGTIVSGIEDEEVQAAKALPEIR